MAEKATDWEFGSDIDGLPVVRFLRSEREGRPWASLLEVLAPGEADGAAVSTADPVEFVLASMAGWMVSCSVEFGEQLRDRGATLLRHGHSMHRDLAGDPPSVGWAEWAQTPLRDGFRAVPCDRDAGAMLAACRTAFGPGHPDHRLNRDEQLQEELERLLSGQIIGPLLPASSLVVDAGDEVVGGLVLTDFDGVPWVAQIFRDPERSYPGLGRELLHRTLGDLARQGRSEVGLAVTEGNPAQRLYESLGFRVTKSTLTVVVP